MNRKSSQGGPVPPFPSENFASGDEYAAARAALFARIMERREQELALAHYGQTIRYEGYCAVCHAETVFSCGWDIYRTLPDGRREPAWRERLVCDRCGLSSRLRASFHLMEMLGEVDADSRVYLSEQTTPFFDLLRRRCPGVVGSEFLRDGTAPGEANRSGLRHEDVTALTFEDDVFDCVGSFEVLEHVPDYKAGLAEMCRVLAPGGSLIASFPFRSDLTETSVRARVGPSGQIEHLLEPEYHGDPLSRDGVLCFYHFGWDILDTMREVGFSQARCLYYWSWELGYLGGAMPVVHAVK
jgi:hypothetical protein